MARPIRIEYPGAMYHVMCRGNNGRDVFFGEDGCKKFLDTLDEACMRAGWFVHAYVLMGNHYHLLLETPEGNLVDGMKWFQGTYTQRINAWQGRRGHLFQGRYKAQLRKKGSGRDVLHLHIGIVSICANTPPCQDRFALSIRAPFTM